MAIGVVKALFKGWGLALRHPQIVLAKWGLNVLGSLVIAVPFWQMVSGEWGNRQAAADLIGGMTLYEATRFQHVQAEAFGMYFWLCALMVIVIALLNLGLTAAALKLYAGNEEVSVSQAFFRDLWALGMVFLLIFTFLGSGLYFLGEQVTLVESPTLTWAVIGVSGLLAWLGWTLFDMARVMVCVEPLWPKLPSYLRPISAILEGPVAVIKALSLMMRYPGSWLLGLLTAGCLLLVWWTQARMNIGFDGSSTIWQPLLLVQVMLLVRTFVVMGSLASHLSYLRDKGEILGEPTALSNSSPRVETEADFDFGLPEESS